MLHLALHVLQIYVLQNINDGMQRLDIRRNNIPDRDPGRPVSMAMAPVRFLSYDNPCLSWLSYQISIL